MKIQVYHLPNGKSYRIRYTKNPNKYLGDGNYVIETLIQNHEMGEIWKKEFPEGKWDFLSYAENLLDAKETLCLFARHPVKDLEWLDQFEEK